MLPRPPSSSRNDTRCPYTTRFRSIVAPPHIVHQRPQPPRVMDEMAQILARARAAGRLEHRRGDAVLDQIFVERGIVLEIDFAAPARRLVERRLRDIEVPALDDLGQDRKSTRLNSSH